MLYNFTCTHKFQSARDSVAVFRVQCSMKRTIDKLSIKFCRRPRKRSSCFKFKPCCFHCNVTNITNYSFTIPQIPDKIQQKSIEIHQKLGKLLQIVAFYLEFSVTFVAALQTIAQTVQFVL